MKFKHWWLGPAGLVYDLGKDAGSNEKKNKKKDSEDTNTETEDSVAKDANVYNYYTNESENGNTLFGSQKKTKRTLFGQ